MKVINEGAGQWNIVNKEGELLGEIRQSILSSSFSRNKYLYVGERSICTVKNQADAMDKLENFFKENRERINLLESWVTDLYRDIELVKSEIGVSAINQKIINLNTEIEKLKEYQSNEY